MLEAYAAYWDYNDMMSFVENLFEKLALELLWNHESALIHPETGETIDIDLKAPWKRLTMKEASKNYGNLDVDQLSDEEMREMLERERPCRSRRNCQD